MSETVIQVSELTRRFGARAALASVSLSMSRGGVYGLVGANGAGKTTLMRLATGQLRPDLGRVSVRGQSAWQATAKRRVGYSPDSDHFYEEMSGRQFVESLARLSGFPRHEAQRRAGEALELVGMAGQAEQVASLDRFQLQDAGDGAQHLRRDADVAALLQPRVPGDAHAGQLGHLLPAQAGRAAAEAVGEADGRRADAGPPVAEEAGQLGQPVGLSTRITGHLVTG